jgi:hypothetical protein
MPITYTSAAALARNVQCVEVRLYRQDLCPVISDYQYMC